MPALSVPNDVRPYLNITGAGQDTELTTTLEAAEAVIAQHCGPLAATATTQRVRGERSQLVVSITPAISLTSVTPVGGSALTVGDLMIQANGVIEHIAGGTFSSRWYDVVYQAGRASLPKDLREAVLALVKHLWEPQRGPSRRPGSAASDAASNTLPGAGYLLPFRVQELMAPHLQPGFA